MPVHLKLASLGIDAPVDRAGIDVAHGVLGVDSNIHRTAWWADGAAPGDPGGSVLIAGHVDRAGQGPGALFRLHEAQAGDKVEVTTANGQTARLQGRLREGVPQEEPAGRHLLARTAGRGS